AAQRRFGREIEFSQELPLPAIPDTKAYRADVGDSQNQKQTQTFEIADACCKTRDGLRIGQIALLRRVAHLEMVADKPGDELRLIGRKAEAQRRRAGLLGAFDLLVAFALPRIVEQHRQIERATVLQLGKEL